MKITNIYLIIINILSFLLMGLDKLLAILNKKRISESSLITISLLGGIIGTIMAMFTFRHKIRKKKFITLIFISLIYIFIYVKILLAKV